MIKKSKLSKLEVSSFITSLDAQTENTVKGGAPTVNTKGYWSHCCPTKGGKICDLIDKF